MPKPKAYDPQPGYTYQLLARNTTYGREWEPCDYAKDRDELAYLRSNYSLAYGAGWEFRTIKLPRKYHPSKV